VDSAGGVRLFISITVGADGLPVVSYHDNTNLDLKVAHCNDAACASAALTTVDSVGNIGYFASITIGADGWPIICYYDNSYWSNTRADLQVARCSSASCMPYVWRR